ncbi:MAG: hypothetical protein ABI910_17195 [Gemmatimonadota bacterium]
MTSLAPGTPPAASPAAIPHELIELVQELAVAVHKRGIYPASHPMQLGAVDALLARLQRVLTTRAELPIGVARSQLLLDGTPTDSDHPLLSELATRLHSHQLGGLRFTAGVARDELDALVGALAESALRGSVPLGALDAEDTPRWPHVLLSPLAFEQLALLDADGSAVPSVSCSARDSQLWGALAHAALSDWEGGDEIHSPEHVARSIERQLGTPQFDEHLSGFLLQVVGELGARSAEGEPALRLQVSQLVEQLSDGALQQLLEMGGDRSRRDAFLAGANSTLGAHAVLDLVRVAAAQDGAPISSAVLRLMRKLAREASGTRASGRGADVALRRMVRHLLRDWTLDDPNPEEYSRLLGELSAEGAVAAMDRRRDALEPERIVEICLEVALVTPSTEAALGRLALRDGVAATLERLQLLPESEARESLVGRLLNESTLREQLTAERPDLQLLTHAVERMRVRAVVPILQAIDARDDADAAWAVTLLLRLGREALRPLRDALPGVSIRVLRQVLVVFDRLDEWPTGVVPTTFARHPDPAVRREAIRFLMRHDDTRESGVLLGLRDADVRTFHVALHAAVRGCSVEGSRLLMKRYEDGSIGAELRARVVRTIANVGTLEALEWLNAQALTTRWWSGGMRLRKGSPEVLATIGAIAQYYRDEGAAVHVLQLAARSRNEDIRRAAAARPEMVETR